MLNPRATFNFLLAAALLLLAACSKEGAGTGVDMTTVTDVAPVPTYTAEKYLQEANSVGMDKDSPVFQQYPPATSHRIVLFDGREIAIPEEMTADDLTKTRWALRNFNKAELTEIYAACRREKTRKYLFAPKSTQLYDMDTSRIDLPQPMYRFCNSAHAVANGHARSFKQ